MRDGYPTKDELYRIVNWDINDAFNLIEFIQDRWTYNRFKSHWGFDISPVLYWELHTSGWSGNEDIISALLQNRMFNSLWYSKWVRGGHYYFEIKPLNIGYKTANEWAKELGVSRQSIHQSKDYQILKISDRKFLFKAIANPK